MVVAVLADAVEVVVVAASADAFLGLGGAPQLRKVGSHCLEEDESIPVHARTSEEKRIYRSARGRQSRRGLEEMSVSHARQFNYGQASNSTISHPKCAVVC